MRLAHKTKGPDVQQCVAVLLDRGSDKRVIGAHKMKDNRPLYFAWTGFQRRQVSMAPHCGFETVFLPVEKRVEKLRKLLTYFRHGWTTLAILVRSRPRVVWVQLPQVPLMWVALIYRSLFRRDAVVIVDCHNAMFRPPWSKVPFGLSFLHRCNVVLVHNADVMDTAVQLGVNHKRIMVVEDPPAVFPSVTAYSGARDMPRPWFVFPASFAQDEPIAELIEAARMTPDVSILITGNLNNCREPRVVASAPPNVRFLGFLSRENFESLIVGCDAVIAFTRFDGIQLSVCGEAVGAGKPMLISDTSTLRRLFPEGNVFVQSDNPCAIAAGISSLVDESPALRLAAERQSRKVTDLWFSLRCKPLLERIKMNLEARAEE